MLSILRGALCLEALAGNVTLIYCEGTLCSRFLSFCLVSKVAEITTAGSFALQIEEIRVQEPTAMTNLEGGLPESLREGSGGESDLAVPATVLPSTTTVDMELSEVQSKGIDTSLHAFQGYDVSHFPSSFFSVEICPFEKHIWRKSRRIIKDRNSFTF